MITETKQISRDTGLARPVCSKRGDWTIHEHAMVTSTNLVSAGLPAWHAVRADIQTNGRGRFQRTWISDKGGLWLSAVVPLSSDPNARRTLPLPVGLAICDVLRELNVSGVRMRWPNDILVNNRKLAGILVDQFSADIAVIGIGINVQNRPEAHDPQLSRLTTRLADLLPSIPGLSALADLLLRQLAFVLREQEEGVAASFARINRLWALPRYVELDLDGEIVRGSFNGVDQQGRLSLSDCRGAISFHEAHEVRHLTEI
jgi:BirA family transcriptional regulator, biotin operon repressor / biotin---[acetyl-CoA-carboxylase] ligase